MTSPEAHHALSNVGLEMKTQAGEGVQAPFSGAARPAGGAFMTTKKTRRRSRVSSKAGRPRKEGDRHPCGKLKPQAAEPNARVLEIRRAMGGEGRDLATAEDPVALALARGWLSESQARAADEFVRRYRRYSRHYGGPVMGSGSPHEVSESTASQKALQDMTDAEKTALFDSVFNTTAANSSDTPAAALESWRAVNAAMTQPQRAEVFLVCVQRSFPQWLIQRCAGHMETPWERKFALLADGLDRVGDVVSRKGGRAAA